MRRQRRMPHPDNDYGSRITYMPLNVDGNNSQDSVQLENFSTTSNKPAHRFENTIEAKVDEGDTLQALALRFHCTVADIKRLNKIDKDNEIFARKVVKIPVTVHSVLLGALPAVHTSGNSSPKHAQNNLGAHEPDITRNPLEEAQTILNEKLLVASVNASGVDVTSSRNNNVNNIIMNSKVASGKSIYTDDDETSQRTSANNRDDNDDTLPLISDILIDDIRSSHIRQIPGPSMLAIDWSGSDCDMSWVCLFVVILALCVVIPFLCLVFLTDFAHQHHHQNASSH